MNTSVRILNEPSHFSSPVSRTGNQDLLEPVDLSRRLQQKVLRLKGEFLKSDGSKLDYKEIRQSPNFLDFQTASCQLNFLHLNDLRPNERKTFFLNIYNTLTIHALIVLVEDEMSVLELKGFWEQNSYGIAGLVYSLDHIEHGILRCNRLHPTTMEHFFKQDDPRLEFVIPTLDPRIHFALNCGAKSCPAIHLFSPENLELGLNLAAKEFCQNDISINIDSKTVRMTQIFLWYGEDFGEDQNSILRWLIPYLSEGQKEALAIILEQGPNLEYNEYDWSID